ncbi:hypothetical protein WL32_17750 [Burkholderia cepacia]|nr:hypothetical protein WL32_17750 [Burkholderia cepacia]
MCLISRLQVEAGIERECDILGDRQRFKEREVLEYHADSQPARDGRRGNLDRLAVPANLPGVGPDGTVDDLHQRALAGAVFAQHRMNLAGRDR